MHARRLLVLWLGSASLLPAQGDGDPDWAFRRLHIVAPPQVGDAAWQANAIDRFVRAQLDAAGLPPAPRADRRTLIRRASFALTGLPPTPEAVAAFLADPADDDLAFATVVDALLASPHYGEHQARHWLDLARYSDSNGLDENLAFANAWRYRDWVVQAHNDDLPYDRFVQLQLAGDLMAAAPDVGVSGHLATGFLALGPRMLAEQDKEKLVLDTVDEQLDLVGRTVLGLTLGCARCHDHKFDPISQRDYYALAGIFRSTKSFHDLEHVSKWFDRELATDEQIAARKAAERARDDAQQALDERARQAVAAVRDALVGDAGRYLLAGHELLAGSVFVQAETAQATNLHVDDRQWGDAATTVLHTHQGGEQFATWHVNVPAAGRYRLAMRYAAAEVRPMRFLLDDAVLAERALADTTGGWQPEHQQWREVGSVELTAGPHVLRAIGTTASVPHLDAFLLSREDAAAVAGLVPAVVRQAATLLAADQRHALPAFWRSLCDGPAEDFAARARNAQGKGGLAALLLGGLPPESPRELAARAQTLLATAAAAATHAAQRRGDKDKGKKGKADEPVRLDDPTLEAARAFLFDAGGLFALSADELEAAMPPETQSELRRQREQLATLRAAVPARAGMAMCVAEDSVKDLPVHYRGNHLTLAATATPRGVPAVFASFVPAPAMPAARSGRAEFAQWLFAPEQALAARVLANRLWQRAFGQGLSRSPSNFGRRGDRPVHRELLDWLAAELRTQGWSQKRLWRTLLLSRTWQQASTGTAAASLQDPDNRLWSHQTRWRLPAESIRDAMLASAGSLDRTLGGSLLGTGDRGYVTNDQSNDAARYDTPRRSLYLPIIRNAMYDFFAAFDYADPSVHLEQRPQSAVAPQALFLLNAPLVRDEARRLATKALAAADDDDGRLHFLWHATLQRDATPREVAAATRWLATARGQGDDAAAFAGVAQALFATNEFVYVD